MKKVIKKQKVCKAAESVALVVKQTQLLVEHHFTCPIYIIERPDFLETMNIVSEQFLEAQRKDCKLSELYPCYMTDNYYDDVRTNMFSEFIGLTAWNILNEQGYAMHDKALSFTEMWTQEHHKHSAMDAHVHGFGSQITGFYFLETPEDCSSLVFHDPRAGKVQSDLPEQDMTMITSATKVINISPRSGMIVFTNSWLSHSFTRHAADKPIKFVHFNLTVIPAPQTSCSAAEVI